MTVAMTQGALNARSKKTFQRWSAERARRTRDVRRPSAAAQAVNLARMAAAMPGNVKIKGQG